MSGHKRAFSKARFREAALKILEGSLLPPADSGLLYSDLRILLTCILGASGVGLAIVLLYHLLRGLLG